MACEDLLIFSRLRLAGPAGMLIHRRLKVPFFAVYPRRSQKKLNHPVGRTVAFCRLPFGTIPPGRPRKPMARPTGRDLFMIEVGRALPAMLVHRRLKMPFFGTLPSVTPRVCRAL